MLLFSDKIHKEYEEFDISKLLNTIARKQTIEDIVIFTLDSGADPDKNLTGA